MFAWEIRDQLLAQRVSDPNSVPSVSSINRKALSTRIWWQKCGNTVLCAPCQDPEKRGACCGAAPILTHSPTLLSILVFDLISGGHCSGRSRRRKGGGSRGGGLNGLQGDGRSVGSTGLILVLVR